jgi:hypothetical protein
LRSHCKGLNCRHLKRQDRVFCDLKKKITFNITTFLNQHVKKIKRYRIKLELVMLNFVRSRMEHVKEFQGSRIENSKKQSTKVLKVTYFEKITCLPTSMLKVKLKIDINY